MESGVRSNYLEGCSSSSGSALPPPPVPPPLELEKRGLGQETEMTDATVEQQGEPKRRSCSSGKQQLKLNRHCWWMCAQLSHKIPSRNVVKNSKPLLLIGSPIDFGGGDKEQAHAILHLAFIGELCEIKVRRGWYFPPHTFAFRRQLGSVNIGGLHEVPRHIPDRH